MLSYRAGAPWQGGLRASGAGSRERNPLARLDPCLYLLRPSLLPRRRHHAGVERPSADSRPWIKLGRLLVEVMVPEGRRYVSFI